MAIVLSVKDVALPAPISQILARLLSGGYKVANIPYWIPNGDMAKIGVTFHDLRAVLRTGLPPKVDANGTEIRPLTAIVTAVGQDSTHTAFRLLVDLTS
jgi:hypothetical protein